MLPFQPNIYCRFELTGNKRQTIGVGHDGIIVSFSWLTLKMIRVNQDNLDSWYIESRLDLNWLYSLDLRVFIRNGPWKLLALMSVAYRHINGCLLVSLSTKLRWRYHQKRKAEKGFFTLCRWWLRFVDLIDQQQCRQLARFISSFVTDLLYFLHFFCILFSTKLKRWRMNGKNVGACRRYREGEKTMCVKAGCSCQVVYHHARLLF